MKTRTLLLVLFSVAFALAASMATPALAQATRTWISGVGDDANPCSRTAPCKTFAGAISKTVAGGEIDCLDPGGFGAITITKSITFDCGSGETGQVGSILVSGTNGIVVAAGASDVVVIKKLSINGIRGSGNGGLSGIRFLSGASLLVDNVNIMHFTNFGIDMATSATSSMAVIDTNITDCVNAGNGGGIHIQPTGSANANVAVKNVRLTNNDVGLWVLGSSAGTLQVSVDDSLSSSNSYAGFIAANANANTSTKMNITRSTSSNNGVYGILGNGAGVGLIFGSSQITGNLHGVAALNSALVSSYQNNQINQNGDANSPPATTTLQ